MQVFIKWYFQCDCGWVKYEMYELCVVEIGLVICVGCLQYYGQQDYCDYDGIGLVLLFGVVKGVVVQLIGDQCYCQLQQWFLCQIGLEGCVYFWFFVISLKISVFIVIVSVVEMVSVMVIFSLLLWNLLICVMMFMFVGMKNSDRLFNSFCIIGCS